MTKEAQEVSILQLVRYDRLFFKLVNCWSARTTPQGLPKRGRETEERSKEKGTGSECIMHILRYDRVSLKPGLICLVTDRQKSRQSVKLNRRYCYAAHSHKYNYVVGHIWQTARRNRPHLSLAIINPATHLKFQCYGKLSARRKWAVAVAMKSFHPHPTCERPAWVVFCFRYHNGRITTSYVRLVPGSACTRR